MLVSAIDVHFENLIALHVAVGGLVNEFFAVRRKVRLGVGSAKCELVDIAQVLFLRRSHIGRRVLCEAEGGGKQLRDGEKHDSLHGIAASVAKVAAAFGRFQVFRGDREDCAEPAELGAEWSGGDAREIVQFLHVNRPQKQSREASFNASQKSSSDR